MRKPSPETELRRVRRELKEALALKSEYQQEAMVLRGQNNKLHSQVGEWRHRFDTLLAKAKSFEIPPSPSTSCPGYSPEKNDGGV